MATVIYTLTVDTDTTDAAVAAELYSAPDTVVPEFFIRCVDEDLECDSWRARAEGDTVVIEITNAPSPLIDALEEALEADAAIVEYSTLVTRCA